MNKLKLLIDLCLFQARPQDFPYSQAWLAVTALVLALAIYLSFPEVDQPASRVFPVSIVHVAAYGFALWAALRLRSRPERFVQTATTVFGTAALLQLVTTPFVGWLIEVRETPDAQLPFLIIFVLGIWTFAVAVHINRHAMDVTVGQSILITLGVQIFTVSVIFMLFGTTVL